MDTSIYHWDNIKKTKSIDYIKCLFGKHKRIYVSDKICGANEWFDGAWAPWKCKHCNAVGQAMPKPQ